MGPYYFFKKIAEYFREKNLHIVGFWTFVFLVFSVSVIGLLTYVVSNYQTKENLTSSAYTSGMTNSIDINHYIAKFGFYHPTGTYTIPHSDFARLTSVVPFASIAADNFNKSYGTTVEPELIVWWTYAEGINGRISFSNCNDSYYGIGNCYHPSSWQLGYGIQFSAIGILKKAFTDMHGNANDAHLVQQVGQRVLDIDAANRTSPRCGGYSCTFPTMTVDSILAGVSTSDETTNNWWASVLSRDPGINAYMNAEALQVSWFNRKLAWGWGNYYVTHWQQYSNDLQTILVNWRALGGCAASQTCFGASPTPTSVSGFVIAAVTSTPTPSPTLLPTSTSAPTPTPLHYTIVITAPPSPTPSPTLFPTPTAVPTDIPTPQDTPVQGMVTENIGTSSADESVYSIFPVIVDVGEATVSTTPAPIAGITTAPITPAPVTEIPSQPTTTYVASEKSNRTLGVFSVVGIIFALLLTIPPTRKKIFLLVGKVFSKKKDTGMVDNENAQG